MSYTYLQEQGEVSSADCFSDIPPSVLLRSNPTAEMSCSNGSGMESSQSFQSGTTCEHSTATRGEGESMSFAEGSPAPISLLPEKVEGSPAPQAGCGKKWPESFAKYDPDSCSWKTRQHSLQGGLESFLETWPRWGLMQDGECWELAMPDSITNAREFGSTLPTPSGTSNHGKNHVSGRLDEWGGSGNIWRKTEIGKLHCPRFEEWMMDWPDRWTELTPLEMDKFQQWLNSHGKI